MWADQKALNSFLEIQEKINPTLSIEVGAYDADFSKAIVNRGIPTYAFEGSPEVFEKFKDGMEGVIYIHKAVTNYDGYINFNYNGNKENRSEVGNNSIKHRHPDEINHIEHSSVECVSLDSYFRDLKDQKIALWIDCEGANREVLEGAKNLLSMVDSIFIEVESAYFWMDMWVREDVIKYLDENGFMLIEEYYAYAGQTNCIFIKKHYVLH